MARPKLGRPTDVETEILTVLWKQGAISIRVIHRAMNRRRPVAFSSVATITRIMEKKGWVTLVDVKRPQKFAPNINRQQFARLVLGDLIARAFDGSKVELETALADVVEPDREPAVA
jgi:BlaI family transcriptional regulator, penicillinase repressor